VELQMPPRALPVRWDYWLDTAVIAAKLEGHRALTPVAPQELIKHLVRTVLDAAAEIIVPPPMQFPAADPRPARPVLDPRALRQPTNWYSAWLSQNGRPPVRILPPPDYDAVADHVGGPE
jgi:hypothetical protein